jgi:imidazolonepropionase-like amidohydrolase
METENSMKKIIIFITAVLLATMEFAVAQKTAIKAGKLLDPEKGLAFTNQFILVDGENISHVGSEATIPSDATIIDLSSSTVLPGLFDCHTHLCISIKGGGELMRYTLVNTTAYRALQGAANALSMLQAGFTTVRDVGNAGNFADSDLRRAIENGLVPGPTIINTGRIIAPFGGQFRVQPEKSHLGIPEYFYADTRDELKKAIRENIHFGAKVIKIVVDDQQYIYSVDDIRFIVEEARRAGLKVAAHVVTEAGIRNAVEAGVASIEHAEKISDEVLQLAKKNNVVLVGTDFTEEILKILNLPQLYEPIVDRLRRAYKIGVTMAYGTDIYVVVPRKTPGEAAMSLIDTWIAAGIPAKVILQSMTANAARLLGIENVRGAIKAGLAADIIAVPENPLDNISTLKKVLFVMKDGRIIKIGWESS